jgi:DNA-binding SARP family transcriptional activator
MVTFGVLGPLVAQDERGPVDLKGPRHRAVLARLLIARGRVVPVDLLVDDLWESPPDGAVGAIQTFVSALRRALEPDRPPRAPARLLVTSGPGYALHADGVDAVDAVRFEAMVDDGRAEEALRLWRGPAYAEFADQPWARGEIARLDELRLLAVERRAAALLSAGRAAEAVLGLETHLDAHPLREDAWRLLALALYRAGRQGDALGALRRARHRLATELGVDPGPALRQLQSDILAHAPGLTPAVRDQLVGRDDELARLSGAAATGRFGLVLVSGDAGAGKTVLVEALARRLAARGWTTTWGSNPEDEGLPSAWPWTQILDSLGGPPSLPDGDPVVARFHWHRAVRDLLTAAARREPLLVVLDDLHLAGAETLSLLASVVTDRPSLLVVGTYRTTEPSAALTDFLGRAARAEPTRIHLGGLPAAAVPELVRATIGRDVDAVTAAAIHRRSGGNPFYVRELARLVDTEGDLTAVPPGVRDVVRRRLAALPDTVRTTLRRAAVVGADIDLRLLPGEHVLDDMESAARNGFLVERGPQRFRFAHELVRDTVYHDISHSRRAHWHAEVAAALERHRPTDVDALAHHHLVAGSPRASHYARVAAEHAERRFASHEAARLWQSALDTHDGDVRTRLDLIMGLVRALAVSGALDRARTHRADALAIAEKLADPDLTARVISAFDVPAIWTDNDDPVLARHLVDVAERVLAERPEPAVRSRLLATIALELRNTGGDRARAAARESAAIARALGDPALLAFALNARFMQTFDRAGLAPERARIGAELVALAAANELVTFEVLGHLVLVQAHSALADLAAADRHAAAADRLGEDYQLPLVSVFTQWYRAMRATIRDEPGAAARYRAAAARLPGTGMSGLDNGILPFALLCHSLQRGGRPEAASFGAYEAWCRPLLGDPAPVPASPRDLLYEARTCLAAEVAIARDDRATMTRLYAALRPAENELAGAGSGLLTLRPVAHYLGNLATAQGHPKEAEAHYEKAMTIATKANAPHWTTTAR